MYKKYFFVVLTVIGVAFFTTCRQPSMIKQLEKSLLQANIKGMQLFGYNPDLELLATRSPQDDLVTITAHGYGANKDIGNHVADYAQLTGYVLTLNLPDHDYRPGDDRHLRHGTLDEILPFLYAVKLALSAGFNRINVYGFSAGGGVVINSVHALATSSFDNQLEKIGITLADKQALLAALQKGVILLDAPLKSVEEVIKGRGASKELEDFARNYAQNNLRPIDTVRSFKGLGLTVIVYFEQPDEILFNTEDAEFVHRLTQANGDQNTYAVQASHGGHCGWHTELWSTYKKLTSAQ